MYPFGTREDGQKAVAGVARGTKEFLGTGSITTITRVPKGMEGHSYRPDAHRL